MTGNSYFTNIIWLFDLLLICDLNLLKSHVLWKIRLRKRANSTASYDCFNKFEVSLHEKWLKAHVDFQSGPRKPLTGEMIQGHGRQGPNTQHCAARRGEESVMGKWVVKGTTGGEGGTRTCRPWSAFQCDSFNKNSELAATWGNQGQPT